MIRVRRGREPAMMAQARHVELPRVRAIASVRRPTAVEIGRQYTVVTRHLWQAQWYKCCYCEHQCQLAFHDLEHYRPKTRADRGPGFADYGYWWLAWTWGNLLFACPGCNRSGKNDRFPLDPASTALQPEAQPPGHETPLLIDPGGEDPMPEIQFRPVRINGKQRWIPFARGGSARGATSIAVARLDRPDLLDLYEWHVDNVVTPAINQVRNAMAQGGNPSGPMLANVQQLWSSGVSPLVDKKRPYSALSYDVISQTIGLAQRRSWGLRLPRP